MKAAVSFFLFSTLVLAQNTCTSSSNALQFAVDLDASATAWPHYWERCVGSGHAALALRSDFQQQLKLSHDKLGWQYIRFHGIFDDDMSAIIPSPSGNGNMYSFFNQDSVYDYLLSIGMKPIIELSFMPTLIASGNETIFHYKGNITPPKDYGLWSDLLVNFVRHLIDRYGLAEVRTWFFETWNEPNCGFWTGTQEEYWHLLKVTSAAIKSVDRLLKVGGPATCQSQWIPETLNFVKQNNVALDFVSTHEYPTDIQPLTRDVMINVMTKAKKEAAGYPLFYTEYNDGLFALHDTIYASAFVIYNIIELQGIPDLLSWWTFTDIFEEGGFDSTPFNEGFGIMTINGIPKPSFRAFEMLHHSGSQRVPTTPSKYETAGILVTKNETSYHVIGYNYNIPNAAIQNQTLCISFKNWDLKSNKATLRRIDEKNGNPLEEWKRMGSPMYPTRSQLEKLQESAKFGESQVEISVSGNTASVSIEVPVQGIFDLTLQ
eukprot:TRINITY_DN2231_c0_g1_i1.p1 TRINITY_DN2231_c0_g1~~TRINITY_DN2231_c0_g1_i1.p1  ORF type:complete len:499 (+),score=189.51 TRINITY_DN2231_c0_g1_i1:33-1499(+)